MLKSKISTSRLSNIMVASEYYNIPGAAPQSHAFRQKLKSNGLDHFASDSQSAPLSWAVRRRIIAVLRRACMILGAGQKSRIGKLGGGAAIGALMFNATAGFAAVAISDGGTVVQGAAVATANSNIGVAGATASDFAIAIVGDADCNTLSSGTTTALGVYGTGVNNTGGLYGFGAQTTATDFVPNSNVGLGQTSGIRNFNSNNAFTGNVQIGANNVARTQAFGLNSLAIGCGVVSQGLGAVGIGLGAISNGSGSVAFGIDARATGQGSIATGVGSRATQVDTIAFGALSQANGASAIAIGAQSNAAAANTIALGKNASASAAAAIAIGVNSVASAADAIAIGRNVTSSGVAGVAIGQANSAQGAGAVALGLGQTAIGNGAVAIGDPNTATGIGALAIGADNTATGQGAIAQGNLNTATGRGAVALGNASSATTANTAIRNSSIAIGDTAVAVGPTGGSAIAIGSGSRASSASTGGDSLALGTGAQATGQDSSAIGGSAFASGTDSLAFGAAGSAAGGAPTTASANASTAIGVGTLAMASHATALGTGGVFGTGSITDIATRVQATGIGSTAIGGNATAGANASAADAIAIGGQSVSSGTSAVAVGRNARANAADTVAVGTNAIVTGANGVAIGIGANSVGQSVALGEAASTTAAQATALGRASLAGNGATAVGQSTQATANFSFAGGNSARATGLSAVALGNDARAIATNTVAIGGSGGTGAANAAQATQTSAIAIGTKSLASAVRTIAIGEGAQATGTQAISIGTGNIVSGINSGAIGDPNTVSGTESYAFGNNNTVAADNAFAIGNSITIAAGLNGAVGIGNATTVAAAVATTSATIGATTFGGFAGTTPTATVSVGAAGAERTVTNVAAGRVSGTSTDAINGSQLFSVATVVDANKTAVDTLGNSLETVTGGGLVINPNGSIATAPSITAAGATFATTTGAIQALNTANTTTNNGLASAIGGGAAVAANGAVTAPTVNVGGTAYTNLTSAIEAAGAGFNLTTGATGTGVANTPTVEGIAAGETVTVTAGNNIVTTQTGNTVAVALNPALTGVTSLAITGGPTINGAGITLAAGDTFDAGGNKIINLAAGSTAAGSTDALNGGQLNTALASVATNLGGGAAYNPVTGAVTAPSYTISGTTYNNVGSALGAVDSTLTSLNSGGGIKYFHTNSTLGDSSATGTNSVAIGPLAVASTSNAIAIGSSASATNANDVALGSLSKTVAPKTGAFTINGGTAAATAPTSVVSVGDVGTERQISNVAAGVVSATSTDAVNGSQLFTTATALNNLGDTVESLVGTGTVIAADGTLTTAPSIAAAGATFSNVKGAVEALNTANTTTNNGLASAIGGGAAVAANGAVTAPTVNVGGTAYTNLTSAIEAAGAGFNLTTGATGTGVANTSTVEGIAAGETVTVTAGNNIVTTQTGNNVAVALNPVLTGVTSLAITGGPTINGAGITLAAGDTFDAGGNKIVNIAAGSTAAGSTDALNGGQLNTALASVATNLGGGATYDPVTGVVTAPGYAIDGTTYNNVGAALAALAADSKFVSFNSALAAASATGTNASAIGPNAQAAGNNALALGANASATSTNSVALGADSQAGAANSGWTGTSFAGVSQTNNVNANGVVSVSGGSTNRQIMGVADGAVNATSTDAISGSQLFATATALDTKATNLGSGLASSLGGGASVTPNGTVTNPTYNVGGTNVTNVGAAINALQSGSPLQYSTAGAPTTANGLNKSQNVTLVGAAAGPVTLDNIAAGTTTAGSTQAVNGGQLNTGLASVAANLGGGSTYNPATGVVTTPTYVIAGTTYNDVGTALGSLATGSAVSKYFHARSTLADSTAVGADSVAIGPNAAAINDGDVALGSGAFSITGGTVAAIAPASVLSIGASGLERQIQNVAAGVVSATSTDAVNGSQLFSVASSSLALGNSLETVTGGGLALNPDGTVATPATVTVGGIAFNDLTSAIQANDAKATKIGAGVASSLGGGAAVAADGTLTAPTYTLGGTSFSDVGSALASLASGTTGIVQQTGGAPGSGQITVGAATGGTSVSVAGTAGNRTVTGVTAGALSAISVDAVNGSQVNTLANSVATNLGGGSTFNPLTGLVTAPSIAVGGTNYTNVTDAIVAGDTKANTANSGLASALGGGAAVAPNGTVTAPSFTVGGTTVNNVGAALAALQTGSPLQYSSAGAPTTANGLVPSQNVTLVGAAAAPVTLDNVAAGATVAGSTQAVNGGQLNTGLASVATNLGGGSTYNPVTGAVTAPSYTVQGTTSTNVGAALASVDGVLTGLTNGTTGLVQQTGGSPGSGQITVGTATGGTSLSVAGTAGNRTITGVTAGTLSATSVEAVNGSQLFATNTNLANTGSSLGSLIGGGTVIAADGSVTTRPTITVGGVAYNDVTTAVQAGDAKTSALGAGLATSLGGGATVAPDGTVTAPSYVLGGTTYNNIGAALTSLADGTTGLVQQVGGAPGTGLLTLGATTGGTSLSVAGTAGNRKVTGVTAGDLSAASVDAVNGAQVNNALTSVASSLGGGATFNPATGLITAPAFTVQGTTYNNVGSAIGGLDSNITALKSGALGLIQFSNAGATRTSANGGTPSQNVTLVGANPAAAVTVSNVAGGEISASSTDAVNGAQIFALGTALGGGSTFGPNGTVTPPAYNVNGSTYNNAGDAFAAVNNSLTGAGIKYFHTNSTQADSAPVGTDSVAIGPVSGAGGNRSISIGLGANAGGSQSIAIGTGNVVSGNNSGAIGDPSTITGNESYVLGNNNNVASNNAFVIGNNVTIAAGNDGSVAIGNAATVAAPNAGAKSINGGAIAATAPTAVVSVGAAGTERQITNVAAGVVSAASTDAVNGSQLFAVGSAINNQGSGLAAALGGGAAVAPDGTVTAPVYTVQGASLNNVGAAIGAVDTRLTALANGTTGIVQQSGGTPGAGAINVGGTTGGTIVSVAGTSGNRVVTGVANGALTATSTDAVNGGQLVAAQAAAAGAATALAQSTAAALGGGSTFNPGTGQLSAPNYSVGGRAYGNVGAALTATNALSVQYVPDANGAPTNAVRLSGNGTGAAVALTNVAAGAVTANSTDAVNGGQLFAIQQVSTGAVQYDRNPDGTPNRSSVTLGTPGTPVTLANVAAGIRASDAVNLGQLQGAATATLAAANTYTDGRINALTFDLKNVAKRSYAGTAAAIALQAPALFEPGAVAMRFGAGIYRGEYALGASVRATGDNGKWSLTGGISGGPNSGIAASAGIDILIGN